MARFESSFGALDNSEEFWWIQSSRFLDLDGLDVGIMRYMFGARGDGIETQLAAHFGGDDPGRVEGAVESLYAGRRRLEGDIAPASADHKCLSMARAAGSTSGLASVGLPSGGMRLLVAWVVRLATVVAAAGELLHHSNGSAFGP